MWPPFHPFSRFSKAVVSHPSLQKEPEAAPDPCQRGVDLEYGKIICIYIYIYIL